MKIRQLEYVLAVARTGNFSKAATELFVSQPNISNSLTQLEDEVGYQIFKRTNQGAVLTPQGEEFVQHADLVMRELKKMGELENHEAIHRFSIQNMFNHTSISTAFVRLCERYGDADKLSLSLTTGSASEIFDNIYLGRCHCGLVLLSNQKKEAYQQILTGRGLCMETINSMHININIRKDHPLLKEEPFPFHKLHLYPYVNYACNTLADLSDALAEGYIDPEKIITVAERETRLQIIIHTDAFGIGCSLHPATRNSEYIHAQQVKEIKPELILVYRRDNQEREEMKQFLAYVREELGKIADSFSTKLEGTYEE